MNPTTPAPDPNAPVVDDPNAPVVDPVTGEPIDPVTGQPVDPVDPNAPDNPNADPDSDEENGERYDGGEIPAA